MIGRITTFIAAIALSLFAPVSPGNHARHMSEPGILALGPAALAAPGGKLGTLPLGVYRCALPGDAGGQAWVPQEAMDFTIGNASTYRTSNGSGTYLLTGKRVTFTRGPMLDMHFDRTGSGTLRLIGDDGTHSRIRCVRAGATR